MNLKNWDIYLSRLFSALCLFLILSEANTWLSLTNNMILVMGYRLFIILTPLFYLLFRHKLTFIAFITMEIGLFFWLFGYSFYGCILFAIGIAVSGYMLKYYSSFSTRGAAGNKIALNLGGLLSGLAILLLHNMTMIFLYCMGITTISFLTFSYYYKRENISQFPTPQHHFKFTQLLTQKGIAWAMVGFVTGVKLIALVAILPQFLILHNNNQLPHWFGFILIFNSIIIVFFQMPIINKIKDHTRITALFPLLLSMILILTSSQMHIFYYSNALIWTLLLSLIECALSYLDKLSQNDGLLLIKEATVGIGSAATVFCMRFFNPEQGTLMIGGISILLLLSSMLLFSLTEPKLAPP